MARTYVWPKKEKEPQPEPLEEGGFAVSFSDPKWESGVKERAEARKKTPAKKTTTKKKEE